MKRLVSFLIGAVVVIGVLVLFIIFAHPSGPGDSPRDDNNTKSRSLRRSPSTSARPACSCASDPRRVRPRTRLVASLLPVAAVADAIGLSHAEAARRLDARGPADDSASSRSTRAIVRENTLTLFNLILLGFAVALVAVGEYADLLFVGDRRDQLVDRDPAGAASQAAARPARAARRARAPA